MFTDNLWEIAARFASITTVVILWVIVILYYWYFFRRVKYANNARTFDERVEGFRPSDAKTILGEFTDADLVRYRSTAGTADMFFPVLYSVAFAGLIVLCAPQWPYRWLILLPFATALFDWLENISVVTVIGRYRAGADLGSWPVLLVIAQRLKFLFFGATVVVALIALGGCIWRWVKR